MNLVCVRQEDTWTWPEYLGEKTAGVCAKCAALIFFEKQNKELSKICSRCWILQHAAKEGGQDGSGPGEV